MIVSKTAVNDFLNRDLKDYSFIKSSPKKEIMHFVNKKLERLEYGFTFKTEPYKHQLACFYIGMCVKGFLFLLDMGLGKSKIVLDILWYRYIKGEVNRALVLVPTDVNVEGWEEQIEDHSHFECSLLYGSSAERMSAIEDDNTQICVLTYPGLLWLVCDLKEGRKGNQLTINRSKLKNVIKNFDAVVLDECQDLRNKDSLAYKICKRICDAVPVKYELSGTPFGRDPIALWTQFYLVDAGETLGESLGVFKSAFFKQEVTGHGFPKWNFDESKLGLLHDMMQNKSIRYSDNECGDLPPNLMRKIGYSLSGPALSAYDDVLDNSIKGEGVNVFLRLRQISSGFINLEGDEYIPFKNNPKMEILRDVLINVPADEKIILFYEFNPSADMMRILLDDMKITYTTVRGAGAGHKKGDNVKNIKKFKNTTAMECKCLLANWASASKGGNLQVASYCFFYESPVSPIERKQCIKRISRDKQKRKTHIIDPVLNHRASVEIKILDFIKQGESLFASIVDGRMSLNQMLTTSSRRKND